MRAFANRNIFIDYTCSYLSTHALTVCTFNSAQYAGLAEITLPNKQAYCMRNGYELISTFDAGNAFDGWDRVRLVAEVLPQFDAVAWIDCDAVITNHDVAIESIVGWEKRSIGPSFFMSYDVNGPNSGTFIARNTPIARQFFHALLKAGRPLVGSHHWQEQEAMIRFLASPPYAHGFVGWVDPSVMNAYVHAEHGWPEDFVGAWNDKSWIMHMAGLALWRKIELAREYVGKMKRAS